MTAQNATIEAHPFNTPPPNMIEVDEARIATSTCFLQYDPSKTEFRQVPWPDDKGKTVFTSLTLNYYWDGTGVALSRDYWGKRIRWFIFGCVSDKHNIHGCPDCGHHADIDSSG